MQVNQGFVIANREGLVFEKFDTLFPTIKRLDYWKNRLPLENISIYEIYDEELVPFQIVVR